MIKKELLFFLIIGVTTVLVDLCTYLLLIKLNFLLISFAKAFGFLSGTIFSYFANRYWTFGNKKFISGNFWRFLVLYLTTLGTNVFVNNLSLIFFIDVTHAIHLSFIIATGVSASLNFLGMKFFVFIPISKK